MLVRLSFLGIKLGVSRLIELVLVLVIVDRGDVADRRWAGPSGDRTGGKRQGSGVPWCAVLTSRAWLSASGGIGWAAPRYLGASLFPWSIEAFDHRTSSSCGACRCHGPALACTYTSAHCCTSFEVGDCLPSQSLSVVRRGLLRAVAMCRQILLSFVLICGVSCYCRGRHGIFQAGPCCNSVTAPFFPRGLCVR